MDGDDDHLSLLNPVPLVVADVGAGVRVCLSEVPGKPKPGVEDHLRMVWMRPSVDGSLLYVGYIDIRHGGSEIFSPGTLLNLNCLPAWKNQFFPFKIGKISDKIICCSQL